MATDSKMMIYLFAKYIGLKSKQTPVEVINEARAFFHQVEIDVPTSTKKPKYEVSPEQVAELYSSYPNIDPVKGRRIVKSSDDKFTLQTLCEQFSYEVVKAKLDEYIEDHNKNGFFKDFCRCLRAIDFGEPVIRRGRKVKIDQSSW